MSQAAESKTEAPPESFRGMSTFVSSIIEKDTDSSNNVYAFNDLSRYEDSGEVVQSIFEELDQLPDDDSGHGEIEVFRRIKPQLLAELERQGVSIDLSQKDAGIKWISETNVDETALLLFGAAVSKLRKSRVPTASSADAKPDAATRGQVAGILGD